MGNPTVGEIPEYWEFTTLGEVCDRGEGKIQTGPFGSQLHASDYVPVGIPSIMPVNIGDNRLVESDIKRITEEDAERLSKHRVVPGDIIYSRRGDVERRALVREEQRGWLCGTGCMKVRLGEGVVDPPFASFYLDHPQVREWIVQHAVGATMPNLNTSIMRSIPFALPPMEEQRAIASILGALDDKIELNRRMNATLESLARAIFKSWFVTFEPVRMKREGRMVKSESSDSDLSPFTLPRSLFHLFPSTFQDSDLGKIPEGWEVGVVRDLCERVENGGTPKRKVDEYWEPHEIPWLTSGEVRQAFIIGTENFISKEGLENSSAKLWPPNTTVVALYGATAAFATILGVEVSANQACCALIPKPESVAFNLLTLQDSFDRLLQQARGSAQQNLSQSIVADLKTLIPPKPILEEFNRRVMPLFEQCIHNERESLTLSTLRDTLLPKLLSGELPVPEEMVKSKERREKVDA